MGREGGVQVSDIKVGDRVRRTEPCSWPGCGNEHHQVGWEGEVLSVSSSGDYLRFEGGRSGRASAYRKVEKVEKAEPKDERIYAWETIIGHPIFKECFNTEGTLLDAVWDRLGDLYEMEQTINELKVADDVTTEAQPFLSAAPNPAIRLEILKLVLSHFSSLTPDRTVDVAEVFATWVEGR